MISDERIKEEFVKAKLVLPKGVPASDVMLDALFLNYKECFHTAERLAKIEVLEKMRDEFMKNTYSVMGACIYIEQLILRIKEGK
jgi:hypothetical protein